MTHDTTFGAWLKRRRRQLDLTQQELAEQVGCSVGTIRKIERNERRPSKQLAELLATELDIPTDKQAAFITFARTEAYTADLSETLAVLDEVEPEPVDLPTASTEIVEAAVTPTQPPSESTNIRHNLPQQPTPFLGREQEIKSVTDYLVNSELQLVTILGPGGMGKTRLALAVAGQMVVQQATAVANGIFFVNLAPLSDVSHIVPAIAAALDISLDGGGEPRQQLLRYLSRKQMLLIMDNCEHLLDGVELIADMLQTAPGLKILATSRERLHLHQEQLFTLHGLDVPRSEQAVGLEEFTAVQLFLQSAQRVQHGFRLNKDDEQWLARICHLVQGMPLAVELAAGWVEFMSLVDITQEIQQSLDFLETDVRNIPARQRSIRAVFDGSWKQLSRVEQEALPQLSVFRGGFTRQAAQEVTGVSLRTLGRLVNKSLLQYNREQDRYQVHELLRQYGLERLAEDEVRETAVRDLHATCYCTFLQQRETALKSAGIVAALKEIDAEIDNVRRAWEWAVAQGHIAMLTQATESLGWFYYWPARHQEGVAAFKQVADKMESIATQSLQFSDQGLRIWVRLLGWQGRYSNQLDQSTETIKLCEKALTVLEQPELRNQDIRLEKAVILEILGHAQNASGQKDISTVIATTEQSLAYYRDLEDKWGTAYVLARLGEINAFDKCDYITAESMCLESWKLTLELGHPLQMVWLSLSLGRNMARQGRFDEAQNWLNQAQEISRKHNYLPGIFIGFLYAADASINQGQFDQALTLLENMLALRSDMEYEPMSQGWVEQYQSLASLHLGRYRQAYRLALATITKYEQRGHITGVATGHLLLANSNLAQGQNQEALASLQHSTQICQETGDEPTLNMVKVSQGYLRYHTSHHTETQQLLAEVLDFGVSHRSFMHVLMSIPIVALLLGEAREVARSVELYTLATSHDFVGNSRWFADLVGQPIEALAATLPPEVVSAAQARGRAMDLWQTAESLLQDLTGQAKNEETTQPESLPPNNLPPQPTLFLGREQEITSLSSYLADPNQRLITIVGPGGMGKTRLAVAVAENILSSGRGGARSAPTHGVYFVALAPLAEPEHIIPALAEALDFPLESGGQQRRSARQRILDYLRQKEMLLVLDNFEHLLALSPPKSPPKGGSSSASPPLESSPASPPLGGIRGGEDLVADILQTAPQVKILVTSRERLHLQQEQVFALGGLDTPQAEQTEDVEGFSAVQLFLQSARRVKHDFQLHDGDQRWLTRICHLVAGMPLAVELAAGWVEMLSLADIAQEIQQSLDFLETDLHNVPSRHRSIQAVFEGSWQRLGQAEQDVLPKLSIFRGGFTRQAAQTITGASLRTLGKLVNKSLLQYNQERDRYFIHELLRQFAVEKLAEDEAVRDKHSAYYLNALHERLDDLKGQRQQAALAEIEADFDNARIAWNWAVQVKQVEWLSVAMDSLGYFLEWNGRYQEGLTLLQTALDALLNESGSVEEATKARLLGWQGAFSYVLQDSETAVSLCQQALALLPNGVNTRREEAFILYQMGQIGSDYEQKKAALKRSLQLQREINDSWGVANTLQILGEPDSWFGTLEELEQWLEECLAIRNKLGDQQGTVQALILFSVLLRFQEEYFQSDKLSQQALQICRAIGSRLMDARAFYNLAWNLGHLGRFDEAAVAYEESATLYQELGDRFWLAQVYSGLSLNSLALGNIEEARAFSHLFDKTFPEDLLHMKDNNLGLSHFSHLEK